MQNNDHSHLFPGVPMALASAVLFGIATPFSKLLLSQSDPQFLAGLLYLGAGVGLALFHLGRNALGLPGVEAPLRRPDLPWLAIVVVFGGIAGPVLLMLGLARTQAASAALLLNLEGLATMGIAWVAFHENVDRRLLLGAFAILAGAVVLSWRGNGLILDSGAVLIAGACIAWGIDNNVTRMLSSADPVLIAMIKGLAAGSINVALALLGGAAVPSFSAVAGAAGLGFVSIGVSLVLFVLALRYLGTARTGAYFSLAPFVGALVAIPLLHEELTPKLAVAAALMGFGLWMHLSERHEHEHLHQALEHEHSHFHDEHHRHKHDGAVSEPHSHRHRHESVTHSHPHYPDLHHRHAHAGAGRVADVSAFLRGRKAAWAALGLALGLLIGAMRFMASSVRETSEPIATGKEPSAISGVQEVQGTTADVQKSSTTASGSLHQNKTQPRLADVDVRSDGVAAALLTFIRRERAPPASTALFSLDRVQFDSGSSTLRSASRQQLRNIAKILSAYPKVDISLGYWAGAGAADASSKLGKARVQSVRRELTRMGIEPGRLRTAGQAEIAFGGPGKQAWKNAPIFIEATRE